MNKGITFRRTQLEFKRCNINQNLEKYQGYFKNLTKCLKASQRYIFRRSMLKGATCVIDSRFDQLHIAQYDISWKIFMAYPTRKYRVSELDL